MDSDEGMEELRCGECWHQARLTCEKKVAREGFKFFDIAATLVENEGRPHTVNLWKKCYNLRLAERNEPEVTHARWKTMIR